MNYKKAVELAKAGKRIKRPHWHPRRWCNQESNGIPYLWNDELGRIVGRYFPSPSDMEATDWEVVT